MPIRRLMGKSNNVSKADYRSGCYSSVWRTCWIRFLSSQAFPRQLGVSGRNPLNWKDGGSHGGAVHGVPGPLVGAGLPVIAVGFGAYWLVRRYRRKPDAA